MDISIALVFFALSARLESLDQELRLASEEFRASAWDVMEDAVQLVYIVVSSAYWKLVTVGGRLSWRSATYRLNNIGPRMDPWRIPNSDRVGEDLRSSI